VQLLAVLDSLDAVVARFSMRASRFR